MYIFVEVQIQIKLKIFFNNLQSTNNLQGGYLYLILHEITCIFHKGSKFGNSQNKQVICQQFREIVVKKYLILDKTTLKRLYWGIG